jgi:prepilin-type N-terminal cleavage/methylation domain-containing protein
MRRPFARGVTLIEVSIVMALSALVVLGMIGFYISSQTSWMAGSTQAIAQRDATLLIEAVSDSVRAAASATVDATDPLHHTLILNDQDGLEFWRFWWDARDQLLHQGPGLNQDRGPVVGSPVSRFQAEASTRLVHIRLVELRDGEGQFVRLMTAAALHNHGEAP